MCIKDLIRSFTRASIWPAIFYPRTSSSTVPEPSGFCCERGFSDWPLCMMTNDGAGIEIPPMLMLCKPEGPAIELWSASGWSCGTPIFTIENMRPFSVLITVDLARIPGPGPLLSSCMLVLV